MWGERPKGCRGFSSPLGRAWSGAVALSENCRFLQLNNAFWCYAPCIVFDLKISSWNKTRTTKSRENVCAYTKHVSCVCILQIKLFEAFELSDQWLSEFGLLIISISQNGLVDHSQTERRLHCRSLSKNLWDAFPGGYVYKNNAYFCLEW